MNETYPTANLKNTTHVNLLFAEQGPHPDFLRAFLDWLAKRSLEPLTEETTSAHIDELARRASGKCLVSVSADTGVSLRDLRFMPVVLRHFSYATIRRPGLDLSLDIFNAADELKLGGEPPTLALELFALDGRTVLPLVEIAKEAAREWPVQYAFGGHHTFAATFAHEHYAARKRGVATPRVNDFLWPLTFIRQLGEVDDAVLGTLPVFRVEREGDGIWLWLFEDLYMGHNDDYQAAASAVGLRTLWESFGRISR